MSRWINIKDQLPEEDVGILITDGKVVVAVQLSYWKGKPWFWSGHGFGGYDWEFDFSRYFEDNAVTHWMELPEIPGKMEGK